jgi:hypothetical protein
VVFATDSNGGVESASCRRNHHPSQRSLRIREWRKQRRDAFRRQRSRNHSFAFTVPLPCFFPHCLSGEFEIPCGSHNGVKQMGWCQTEIYYPMEASYLRSVLLWLQEYWTGPKVHVYPLRRVPQASQHYSVRRTLASPNRRGEIVDLPAFLPPRSWSQYRQRKAITVEGWQRW